MPSTFFGLSIGNSGLYASQAGLNTTAHNIANIETEGFSRQVAKQQAGTALRVNSSYGMVGTGVDIKGVSQIRDEYYDLKFMKNNTMYGAYTTKEYYLTSIENYFNEVKLEGFLTNFDNMYNSLQELSKQPEDLTVRTQVTNMAQSTCDYVNSLSTSLGRLQEECNFEIKNQVERVNSLAQQVAIVTKQINTIEVNGGTANDLRDQRALMVEELSGFATVSVSERIVGDDVGVTSYTVKLDGQTLVDTYEASQLKVVPRDTKVNQLDANGLFNVCWSNGQPVDLNSPTMGGTLKALLQVRDGNNKEGYQGKVTASAGDTTITVTSTNKNNVEDLNIATNGIITIGNREYHYNGFAVTKDDTTGEFIYEFSLDEEIKVDVNEETAHIGKQIDYKGIPYYMAQLNKFARTYGKAFNDVHKSGQDLNGEQGLDFFNGVDVVTGKNFIFDKSPSDEGNGYLFTSKTGAYAGDYVDEPNFASYYFLTADTFEVTKAVYTDPKKLAAASSIENGVANADIIEKLLALKDDVRMFGQGKPAQFFQTLVAEIGIDAKQAGNFAENQKNILSAVQNQRLSISGVDQEEEAMGLVRYQKAYNLSAKVISVMDQIYDRLINYMGA
ncbi:MAG TPA: flagellar hook-associated protein FlgK [Lachnoclostridium phytofermentans]|uniref:Flagellar hook-associated protein 1 n=1 Tax=Lachnoclostridium phytofermentans TaxID=66219 RepID=A0A3D2X1U3_9FIRM|nr:flagellar hook-associated protein FlgK [Lachnoclostridium sp.]HCL00864.1 flagellar hook-associated protein FlgK [Lachnoclostridium phytofermentans]